MADHNLGLLAMNLYSAAERVHLQKMAQDSEDIEKKTENIEKIQQFLTVLNERTKGSKDADFRSDPPMMELIDQVADICKMEKGIYFWKNKEIDSLLSTLNSNISTIESRITQKTTHLTQTQYESNDLVEIMTKVIDNCKNLIKRINDNINRSR